MDSSIEVNFHMKFVKWQNALNKKVSYLTNISLVQKYWHKIVWIKNFMRKYLQ